jgi:hypothetical protein
MYLKRKAINYEKRWIQWREGSWGLAVETSSREGLPPALSTNMNHNQV